jgi:hypothetical protein
MKSTMRAYKNELQDGAEDNMLSIVERMHHITSRMWFEKSQDGMTTMMIGLQGPINREWFHTMNKAHR